MDIKAQLAKDTLKNTHRLVTGHLCDGHNDYDLYSSGKEEAAKEVKYLILRVDHPPVIEACLSLPDDEVTLTCKDIEEEVFYYGSREIAHGSTEDEAWAMAYDLHERGKEGYQ